MEGIRLVITWMYTYEMTEDESLNFVGRVAQKAIIQMSGKVLLMRNLNRPTWELPGGRLHAGEDPKAGLAREIKEELAIDITVGKPVYTSTFMLARTNEPHFLVVYECSVSDPAAELVSAADEVEEYKWFAKEELAGVEIWKEYKEALDAFFAG